MTRVALPFTKCFKIKDALLDLTNALNKNLNVLGTLFVNVIGTINLSDLYMVLGRNLDGVEIEDINVACTLYENCSASC